MKIFLDQESFFFPENVPGRNHTGRCSPCMWETAKSCNLERDRVFDRVSDSLKFQKLFGDKFYIGKSVKREKERQYWSFTRQGKTWHSLLYLLEKLKGILVSNVQRGETGRGNHATVNLLNIKSAYWFKIIIIYLWVIY